MKNLIKVNKNWMFDSKHLILTETEWVKAEDLKVGDKVITITGKPTVITKIMRCKKRPAAKKIKI